MNYAWTGTFVLCLYSGLYVILGILYARSWAMKKLTTIHKQRLNNKKKHDESVEKERIASEFYAQRLRDIRNNYKNYLERGGDMFSMFEAQDARTVFMNKLRMYAAEREEFGPRATLSDNDIYLRAFFRLWIWWIPCGWWALRNLPVGIGKLIMWRRPLTKFEIEISADAMRQKIKELERWNKENDPANREP